MDGFRSRIAAVVVAASLAACGGGGDDSSAGTTSSAPAQTVDRDRPVRLGFTVSPGQWDPIRSTTEVGEFPYLALVYDRLLQLDAEGDIVPMLASAFEFSDNGLSLTLTIREGVTFHDGATLDPQVVVDNLNRARSEPSIMAGRLTSISDVAVAGDDQVVLTLAVNDPTILYELVSMAGAMVSPNALADPALQQQPVGAGPYVLMSATPDRAVYEFFEDYWDTSVEYPRQREIVGMADSAVRLRALESDALDVVQLSSVELGQAQALADAGPFTAAPYFTSPRAVTLFLNTGMEAFQDVAVRRALSLAIDREAVEAATDGACVAMNQWFLEGSPFHSTAAKHAVAFDPDQARDVLERRGLSFTALVTAVEPGNTAALIVQQMLADVGVQLELRTIEPAQAFGTWRAGGTEGMINGATLRNGDPSTTLDYSVGRDNPGGAPEELTARASAARVLELGSDDRAAAYQEISGHLVENPIHVPICGFPTVFAGHADLIGVDTIPNAGVTNGVDTRGVVYAG